jgi:hypothetical protein
MKTNTSLFFLCALMALTSSASAYAAEPADSARTDSVKKRPWMAAAEIMTVNLLVMGYDHLFLDMPCYRVTSQSIKDNFKLKRWWWDSDYYHTNALNHPYHGALYYTAARDNDLDIGVSSLMTLGGSLTWELFCESERPAFNDLITTPVGGITLGEPMHRISERVLDDSKRGLERVGREVVAFAINPVKGINRLLRGDTWRVKGCSSDSHQQMEAYVETGIRRLDISDRHSFNTPYLMLDVNYGDAMGEEGHGLFDYFTLRLTAIAGKEQPHVSSLMVKNQLWCRSLGEKGTTKAVVGLYNHYDYTNSLPNYEGTTEGQRMRKPYGYMEIASIGPGIAFRTGNRTRWEQQLFVNGIGLGATPIDTEHKSGNNHGYSFGSGYGARMTTDLRVDNWLHAAVNGKFSQLFCWDGFFDDDPDRKMGASGKSIQGEEGNAVTFIAEPTLEIMPFQHFGIGLHGRYFWCHSNYKHHPHATTHSWELHAGVCYRF